MSMITQFKLCPDHRAQTAELFGQIIAALRQPSPYTEDQIVTWDGLERITLRFIGSAQAIGHPIGVHCPEFWDHWRRFVDRNQRLSTRRRAGQTEARSRMSSPELLATTASDGNELGSVYRGDPRTGARLAMMPRFTSLDNGTDIAELTTTWGEDDAQVVYQDQATGILCGERGSVAIRFARAGTVQETDHDTAAHRDAADADGGGDASTECRHADVILLSEVIRQRLDALAVKLGNRRADESHGRVLRFALDLLGDIFLHELTKKKLRTLELALGNIPDRKGVPKAANASLHTRYLYASKNGWGNLHRISKTTLKNTYFGCMNSLLVWAREKFEWSAPEFHFDQEVAEAPAAEDRDAFSDEELIRFFSLPLFTGCVSSAHIWKTGEVFVQNAHYWGYVIHFFMGLRPSEIGQLLVGDIVQYGDMHWIDLRDDKSGSKGKKRLKSKAARRRVPIPKLLIDLGLSDYAEVRAKQDRLFEDWTIYDHPQSGRKMYGHFLSKSWQYVKVTQGFERKNLSLYSARHTLAGWYDAKKLPDRIRLRLLGHAPTQVAHGYGPQSINDDEARAALSEELKIQFDIADVLLTAKLKAELGMLRKA